MRLDRLLIHINAALDESADLLIFLEQGTQERRDMAAVRDKLLEAKARATSIGRK